MIQPIIPPDWFIGNEHPFYEIAWYLEDQKEKLDPEFIEGLIELMQKFEQEHIMAAPGFQPRLKMAHAYTPEEQELRKQASTNILVRLQKKHADRPKSESVYDYMSAPQYSAALEAEFMRLKVIQDRNKKAIESTKKAEPKKKPSKKKASKSASKKPKKDDDVEFKSANGKLVKKKSSKAKPAKTKAKKPAKRA